MLGSAMYVVANDNIGPWKSLCKLFSYMEFASNTDALIAFDSPCLATQLRVHKFYT